MTLSPVGELISLRTFDGLIEYFPTAEQSFPVYGGFGAPPTEFKTYRGYKHHGARELAYALQPRLIMVELHVNSQDTRQDYWDERARLLNLLRPNRNGQMTLTLQQPSGAQRSIDVRPNPGLPFPPDDANAFAIDEPLEFIAFNPIWYDATVIDITSVSDTDDELVFPITFPIHFGSSDISLNSGNISYQGTWDSFPTFVFTGPYTWLRVESDVLDAVITLTTPIGAGEQRTLDLTPGKQSLLDQDGNNRFDELGDSADLVNFAIRPDPYAPDGVQQIIVTMNGKTGDSNATMSYYNRYFAI